METKITSAFDNIENCPVDPIIEIFSEYYKCQDPNKMNLTVGSYRDENLQPVVFNCVREAENKLFSDKFSREYLSPTGDEEFNKLTQKIIFPEGHPVYQNNQILTVQSISGSGGIRLAGEFISRSFESKKIYIPSLTWPNHQQIFKMSNLIIETYRYYDLNNNKLDIDGLLSDLENAENGSTILLQVCGHNPTGIDPSKEEWKKIAEVMSKKDLFPFFDNAYQGFVSGDLMTDAYPILLFYDLGFEMFISESFSKMMGLYGERAGPLHLIIRDPDSIPNVKNQLSELALGIYLTPVGHGSRIIKTVLSDEKLKNDWLHEIKHTVAQRMKNIRIKLYENLVMVGAPGNWKFILNQKGMFSYTGLTKTQCEALINHHRIFLVKTGRISLTGINDGNVERLALAIKDVKENYI
jgi:aspartate/tyrosine/aromatic aminotransferase